MPEPQQFLAEALRRVQGLATDGIVRGPELSRRDRQLLTKRGFLIEIIKGWYALATPENDAGDTTFWHAHFWSFIRAYLSHRFGSKYCLSAEYSLDLWTGNSQTPSQLVVIAGKGGASTLKLPNATSLLIYADSKNLPTKAETIHGVQVMPLATALTRVAPSFFRNSADNAEIAVRLVNPNELIRILLSEKSSLVSVGRLIGAARHCGLTEQAKQLTDDITAAGLEFKESNPFAAPPRLSLGTRLNTPHAGRLKALWNQMLPIAANLFPESPKASKPSAYLKSIGEIHKRDAYNSLSIEGYQVTPELIDQIESGHWNPEANPTDQSTINAMAAKGYFEAFQTVSASIQEILGGQPVSKIANRNFPNWYRKLFSPSVQSGLLSTHALAGFRNRPVFIRGSHHIPPPHEAVPELMELLFQLLDEEAPAGAKAILAHFLFVYIHPYSDGNGRIGRFLLNVFLAAGHYPWTVIRVEKRSQYMTALETASVKGDISDFTSFIASEMEASKKHGN